MNISKFIAVSFIFSMASIVSASTLYVSLDGNDENAGDVNAPLCSIGKALECAEDGDEILVSPGEYAITEQLVMESGVTLRSLEGRENTTIRQTVLATSGESRVLLMNHPSAKVVGFTLTGGSSHCSNDTSSDVSGAGAGVRIDSLGGTLENCIIKGNVNGSGNGNISNRGGAIAIFSANAVLKNCIITQNVFDRGWYGYGSAIYATGGLFVDCEFSNNTNNSQYAYGSLCFDGPITMRRCKVIGNVCPKTVYTGWNSWRQPGGISLRSDAKNSLIENCLIADNRTLGEGGGIAVECVSDIVSCTIVNNSAKYGGGVFSVAAARFRNCIIQGNTASEDVSAGAPEWNGGTAKYSYSLSPKQLPTGDSNITGSAMFKSGGYSLSAGSPGFDAGSIVDYEWLAETTDLNGDERIWNESIDIGAYEFSSNEIQAEFSASSLRILDGSTIEFSSAVIDPTGLGYDLKWLIGEEEIAVTPGFSKTFAECGDYLVSLVVTPKGGEPLLPVTKTVTVVSHDIFVGLPSPAILPQVPYNTPEKAFTDIQSAIDYAIDGCTIHLLGGNYEVTKQVEVLKGVCIRSENGPEETTLRNTSNNGRALYLNHASATIEGIGFIGTKWNKRGAEGVGCYIGAVGGTIRDCIFRANEAALDMNVFAAAICANGGLIESSLFEANTNGVGNMTYTSGGGPVILKNGAVLKNSRVIGNVFRRSGNDNSNAQPGGGIVAYSGSKVINCLVMGNDVAGLGGGIYLDKDSVVSNCTICLNTATKGGGIYANGAATVVNSALYGNHSSVEGDSITGSGVVAFSHSFDDKSEITDSDDTNLLGIDPKFISPEKRNFGLLSKSPLRNTGVFADWMALDKDVAGAARVDKGEKVDIGCFECHRPLGTSLELK